MAKILIAEDDEAMRILMEVKLKKENDVYVFENGKSAYDFLCENQVDLLLLDVMMPIMDGYELITKVRDKGIETPAIMITAKSSVGDKIKGLESGSDDYMTKPIDFDELNARIKAILRRNKINQEKEIKIKDIIVNSETYSIKTPKEKIYLPQKEFKILFKLLSYPEIIFTKEQLLDSIWGITSDSDEATIRTHINRLRSKIENIEEFELITMRGIGYKAVINGNVNE